MVVLQSIRRDSLQHLALHVIWINVLSALVVGVAVPLVRCTSASFNCDVTTLSLSRLSNGGSALILFTIANTCMTLTCFCVQIFCNSILLVHVRKMTALSVIGIASIFVFMASPIQEDTQEFRDNVVHFVFVNLGFGAFQLWFLFFFWLIRTNGCDKAFLHDRHPGLRKYLPLAGFVLAAIMALFYETKHIFLVAEIAFYLTTCAQVLVAAKQVTVM